MPTPHDARITVVMTILACLLAAGCQTTSTVGAAHDHDMHIGAGIDLIPAADVQWGALNPARGTAGPRAADLWGDRTGSGATGFLVRFAEGFSSPPHTHNTTYRGVVIEGLVHNDDPDAENFWMPAGSYWSQPAGGVHITSARGAGRLAYIEIQHGPYLVLPTEDATDIGEHPINVHASNLVWLDATTASGLTHLDGGAASAGPHISYLWGDPQSHDPHAALVRLPAGSMSTLHTHGRSLRVVVITGQAHVQSTDHAGPLVLDPGSYVGSQNGSDHLIALTTNEACVLYVRSEGAIDVNSSPVR